MLSPRMSIYDLDEYHHVSNPHQRYVSNTERKKSRAEIEGMSAGVKEEKPSKGELHRTDTFHHDTKSLLVLFQLMGIMPIQRASAGHMEFNLISKPAFWAYFIFLAETAYVTIVFKARLELTLRRGKRFDEYIYNFIFLIILVPHFLLPLAAWRNGSEVAIYKNMWTNIQNKYWRMTGEIVRFPRLYGITWALCIISWIAGIVVILAQFYLQPDLLFWHTLAYYPILAMMNCLCSLWFVNCRAQGQVASELVRFVKKALESPDATDRLGHCRGLWVDLFHLMQQLGKAYSGMYSMFFILILLTTIVATYGCLSEILDHGLSQKEIGLFMISTYTMSILFLICNEAYHASRKMGYNVQETQKEIQMFLTAIDKNPPTMNLNGFANINRQLITSVMASMGTYLVMLMEFKMSLNRSVQRAAMRNTTLGLGNYTLGNNSTML